LQGAVEQRLGELWTRLLDVSSFTRDDDFFDLGGHSLLAMRVLAQINAAFEVEIPLQQIFEHRSIAALATAIERAPKISAAATLGTRAAQSAIAEAAVAEVASLSDAQIDALLAGDLAEAIEAESLP
jgi:acyl carrier protein